MRLPFRRRSAMSVGYILGDPWELPAGYHRLLDSPEVSSCINRIASIIASSTVYLMHNTDRGDTRIRDGLSRLVDIDPWPGMGNRFTWMHWIVSTLIGDGDGNAFVLPHVEDGKYAALEPMPGACAVDVDEPDAYRVLWNGNRYHSSEVLHFKLFADPTNPWKGRGYRVQAMDVAESLAATGALKKHLSSPRYKPPLAVFVNSDNDFADEEKRENFRKKYLSDTGDGKPWIFPADLVKVEQLKPLSLTDLAVKDTVELDKRTVASIFGVPEFWLGVGSYNASAHNSTIRTVIVPICATIEQTLTLGLLENDKRYFKISRRRLYDYDLKTLIDIDCAMADRGYLCGDEVRDDADRDPAGLTEYKVLENYIPYDMSANQKKLSKEDSDNA